MVKFILLFNECFNLFKSKEKKKDINIISNNNIINNSNNKDNINNNNEENKIEENKNEDNKIEENKNEDNKIEENKLEDYSSQFNAEFLPELCNEFYSEFMEPNNFFNLNNETEMNEILDIIQHFCIWLFKNEYTKSKLSLANN